MHEYSRLVNHLSSLKLLISTRTPVKQLKRCLLEAGARYGSGTAEPSNPLLDAWTYVLNLPSPNPRYRHIAAHSLRATGALLA